MDAVASDDSAAMADGRNDSGGDAGGQTDGAGPIDGGAEGSLEGSSDTGVDGTAESSADASRDASLEGSSTSSEGGAVSSYDGGGGGVLLFGGFAMSGAGFFDTWRFDGASWSLIADAGPGDRWETAMAPLFSGVVLFGGVQEEPSNNGVTVLDDTWLFGPTTWTLSNASGPPSNRLAPQGRGQFAMAALGSEVVIFGGNAPGFPLFGDTWVFDGQSWSQPTGRARRRAATTPWRPSATASSSSAAPT